VATSTAAPLPNATVSSAPSTISSCANCGAGRRFLATTRHSAVDRPPWASGITRAITVRNIPAARAATALGSPIWSQRSSEIAAAARGAGAACSARAGRRRHQIAAASDDPERSRATKSGKNPRCSARIGVSAGFGCGARTESGITLATVNAAVPPGTESASPRAPSRHTGGTATCRTPGAQATTV